MQSLLTPTPLTIPSLKSKAKFDKPEQEDEVVPELQTLCYSYLREHCYILLCLFFNFILVSLLKELFYITSANYWSIIILGYYIIHSFILLLGIKQN